MGVNTKAGTHEHGEYYPVSKHQGKTKHTFINLLYRYIRVDLSNVLRNRKVQSFMPPYSSAIMSIISHDYTKTISSSIFNNIKILLEFQLTRTSSSYFNSLKALHILGCDHNKESLVKKVV